jgi:hypothetical protein
VKTKSIPVLVVDVDLSCIRILMYYFINMWWIICIIRLYVLHISSLCFI